MANFSVMNSTAIGGGATQQAISATYKSLVVACNSSATTSTVGAGMFRRCKIYDILIGTNGTPADNFMEYDVVRATIGTTPAAATLGISSLSSNLGLDPADSNGFVQFVSINSTAEGGITALTEAFYIGMNQRASYRWVAAPGSELVYAANSSATGNNGMTLRARSAAYTGTATGNLFVQEQ